MTEIRTTKIDGVEFVALTDYLRLKEEKQELEYLGDINEELKEENKKLKEERNELKERYDNLIRADKKQSEHIEELEEENKKLKEENKKLRYTLDNISFSF